MKGKTIKIINLIFFIVAVLVVVGQAFAWFTIEQKSTKTGFGGSSTSAYFAGGSGTSSDPYLISDKQHLYNLAWLQDKGLLVSSESTTDILCFKVTQDINMAGMILPPIGTADNPFNGSFDGGGNTISNLNISTDYNVLTKAPSYSATFSNYVGMFGMTGASSVIKNFILVDPRVEVADLTESSVKYYSGETKVDTSGNSGGSYYAVGLAVGNVQGKVSSIGVKKSSSGSRTGQLSVQVNGYTTYNGILGRVDTTKAFITGSSSSSGDGNSFGANFNVTGMLDRLNKIKENKGSSDILLPTVTTNSDGTMTIGSGQKMAFSVEDEWANVYYNGTATKMEKVSSLNTGYFLGNLNKIQQLDLTFGEPLENVNGNYYVKGTTEAPTADSVPNIFYKYNGNTTPGYYSSSYLEPITTDSETYASLPEDIKSLLPSSTGDEVSYTTIKLGTSRWTVSSDVGKEEAESSYPFYYNSYYSATEYSNMGQISWDGNTYGNGYYDGNKTILLTENADGTTSADYVSDYSYYFFYNTDGVVLPTNGIWFKPSFKNRGSQKIRFVMLAESNTDSVVLLQVKREGANVENPFTLTSNTLKFKVLLSTQLPAYVLVYYEIDIPDNYYTDGNLEYVIINQTGSGAHFVYMDIGASGDNNSSSATEGEYTTSYDVSAVDFIYEGVTISSTGNFVTGADNTLYQPSGYRIYITSYAGGLYLDFKRTGASDLTVTANAGNKENILYEQSSSITAVVLSLLESDDVKFTFPSGA